MKRTIIVILATIMSFVAFAARADNEIKPVSIAALQQEETVSWKQTYEAYGRTIEIDVNIDIPAVLTAPVIRVVKETPIPEPENSSMVAKYKKLDKKDSKHYYMFSSDDYETIRVEHKYPVVLGTSKKNDSNDGISMNVRDVARYDVDEAYADNNPLTVKEAVQIAREHFQEYYPDTELTLDTFYIQGSTYWRKSGKMVHKKGSYWMNLTQSFHGIPFKAEIRNAFTREIEDWWGGNPRFTYVDSAGTALGLICDEDSWLIVGLLYREAEIICDDIPVLPFDAVKDKVERKILDGYVRWINSITLGYVQFDTENPAEQILLPCWVVWCEYHPDGPASEKTYGINDSELFFDKNNAYYRPLIINAQTGEMIDPESVAEDRHMCPDLSAWLH